MDQPSRPQLPEGQSAPIDALLEQVNDAMIAQDFAQALGLLDKAWELLPEPRYSWDYYAQGMSLDAVAAAVDANLPDKAVQWCDRMDLAYQPHSEASRVLVDQYRAETYLVTGQKQRAWQCFDAGHKVLGKRFFRTEEHFAFYRSWQPAAEIPQPGDPGAGAGATLADDLRERVDAHYRDADNYLDLGAPQAAVEQLVAALELLPEPRSQWEVGRPLYAALGDAFVAATRYTDALTALEAALLCPAVGSVTAAGDEAHILLRLGDAHRGLGDSGLAFEAYARARELGGEEIFEDEEDAWELLDSQPQSD